MHRYSGFPSQGQITKREVQIKTWMSNAPEHRLHMTDRNLFASI